MTVKASDESNGTKRHMGPVQAGQAIQSCVKQQLAAALRVLHRYVIRTTRYVRRTLHALHVSPRVTKRKQSIGRDQTNRDSRHANSESGFIRLSTLFEKSIIPE